VGSHKVFDDGGVLVALVLEPEGVFGAVDELADALASVADTPDEMGVIVGRKFFAVPVGVEALGDPATSCACEVTMA
jgi:hypothetical protein